MTTPSDGSRLEPGYPVSPMTCDSLRHGRIAIPGGGFMHLQFRRFAGCPICSLHLRSFARRHGEIEAAGVRVVAFFHSSAGSLRRYHLDLPFPVVADAERELYRRFGVERSGLGVVHPRAIWASLRGMVSAPNNPFDAQGGVTGMPADFLIDGRGRVLALHYGAHADDSWDVDDLLRLAGEQAQHGVLRRKLPE